LTNGPLISGGFGSGETLMGYWGHPDHSTFGMMFPLFSQRHEMLCQMAYGHLREMNL
jgi:hypothetical protein